MSNTHNLYVPCLPIVAYSPSHRVYVTYVDWIGRAYEDSFKEIIKSLSIRPNWKFCGPGISTLFSLVRRGSNGDPIDNMEVLKQPTPQGAQLVLNNYFPRSLLEGMFKDKTRWDIMTMIEANPAAVLTAAGYVVPGLETVPEIPRPTTPKKKQGPAHTSPWISPEMPPPAPMPDLHEVTWGREPTIQRDTAVTANTIDTIEDNRFYTTNPDGTAADQHQ